MKKLMTVGAAIAACAMFGAAYGEGAELLHMQGFESLSAGANLDPTLDDAGGTGTRHWLTDSVEEGAAVVTAYEEASTVGGNNFLKLDTGAQRLERAINDVEGSAAEPWNVMDVGPVYLDTMVQFTATDTAPAPAEGDKIAIWLREIEGAEEGTMVTNLMITAGYMGDPYGGDISVSNYVTTANVEAGKWYRLQVQMLQAVDDMEFYAGFVVMLDGNVVRTVSAIGIEDVVIGADAEVYNTDTEIGVFPSLVDAGLDDGCCLTSASFQGSGAIDNVAWYAGEIPPPEPPAETYEVTFTDPQNAEITATVDGKNIISGAKVAAGKTVVFTLTPATGYEYAVAPDGWEKSDNVCTKSVGIVDEDYALTTPVAPTPIVTMFTVTFSTNDVTVAGAETTVADGGTLEAGQIPPFKDGTWDVDPAIAVITCNTNFNYTIAAAPSEWDIPGGGEYGINTIKEGADAGKVKFSSITFTAEGATVGLAAGEISVAEDGTAFSLICKEDLTSDTTTAIPAVLKGTGTAGVFTIEADDLTGKDQLFIIGVGPAVVE